MTLSEYHEGLEISVKDPQFYALIQAAMRKADTRNLGLLKRCWPETYQELVRRYNVNAPGGRLLEDLVEEEEMKPWSKQ